MVRRWAIILVLGFWAASNEAKACSCGVPANLQTFDERVEWALQRAANVVQGRIVEIQASENTLRDGKRVVLATMKVTSVVKGELSSADLVLVTTFGGGDCGIGGLLLSSVGTGEEVALEVYKAPERQNEFWVGLCGYGNFSVGQKRRPAR